MVVKTDPKVLIVGQEIALKGEIGPCDRLVVDGHVDAHLTHCKRVEVSRTGQLNGKGLAVEADISGLFDGELTVTGRLVVRSTGQVRGTIRYAEIEIENGGRVGGKLDVVEPEAEPAKMEG